MKGLLFVMIGGGVGAGLRYGVGIASMRAFGMGFPWGTVICNVAGSLAMGLFVGAMAHGLMGDSGRAQDARLLLAVGLLGGFTTFSSFSLDALSLWQRGEAALAAFYVLGSVAAGLGGFVLGLKLMRGAV
ncbi:MAG: fluoride efflux transporter CrcB [Alphaproteobacteria bacterium]|jgi:fluoride exporter|nr:fluoride efflux transporter CrcB [Alphaproteobacteria bacterium]